MGPDLRERRPSSGRRSVALAAVVVLAATAIGAGSRWPATSGLGTSGSLPTAPVTPVPVVPALGTVPGAGARSSGTTLRPAPGAQALQAIPAPIAPPQYLGPADPSDVAEVALDLRLPGEADLQRYLAALSNPASPDYRHFLTAAQFGERFGLPLDRVDAVVAWAQSQGLAISASYDQRTAIRVRGTLGRFGQLFGVRFASYLDPATNLTYHAPLGTASVPAAIAASVDGVSGLSSAPLRTASGPTTPRSAAGGRTGFGPLDLAKAYDILPLYQGGLFGEGQTVAIVSFDTFRASDIAQFDRQMGVDGPAVKRIAVGPKISAPGNGSDEVTLDIDVLRSVAPRAQILNFEAPNSSDIGFADMFDAIVQDGRADIVTVSWGGCDEPDAVSGADRTRTLRSLQAATARGISVFVASGDWGAFTCWISDPSDQRQSVYWPSDSPYTIAVGGTNLRVRSDGTYYGEAAWDDYLSTAATGGGLNPQDPRPSWQQAPGVENQFSNGNRQTPDVAAAGDPDTGYLVYETPTDGGPAAWTVVGGTSGAAPFWAGIMLLTRQLAQEEGVGPLGFVDPMLYDIASNNPPNTIFHDVTRGGNLAQQATPGWDYATGLGTPDVTALADAIVRYLHDHPPT
ncbi:MAG TPA: S53 family peptidase [Candidatus Saccharimonadales bacterium]|nr:S53 family peptidase [Candidatus Saccharimonadales bacterium]